MDNFDLKKYLVENRLNNQSENSDNEDLIYNIVDIITNEVYLRDVKYGDGDQELDPTSVNEAAKKIVQMLINK
jgi:hypothetical protein